jgi:erythromycin esterase
MEQDLITRLQKEIYPVRTVVADGDISDLQPLEKLLDGVRIVGLGEGSHGTREHFQMKHRLIRFLVERMGFSVFAIEAGSDACLNINDYVRYGKGNRDEALASQSYWTWDTEEVTALIDWMRAYNLACEKGAECAFLGFDIKPVTGACEKLMKLLAPIAGADGDRIYKIAEECGRVGRPEKQPETLSGALWLLGWITANEIPVTRATRPDTFRLLRNSAALLCQYLHFIGGANQNAVRDRHMAENVIRLVSGLPAQSKVILWAHNGHIANGFEWKNMGRWLREAYGSLYYALGFALGGGSFQSRLFNRVDGSVGPLTAFEVPEICGSLWECDFKKIQTGNYFLDLRSSCARSAPIREWASAQRPLLMLDEAYDPVNGRQHYEIPCTLSESYDGILYTEHTERARPNPTGRRD